MPSETINELVGTLSELETRLKHFDAELERIARSFNDDVLRLDSHDSVGPPLAALLSRREAAWRARRRG